MEVQEVKEQLKEIFRTVINNDKWITIHPHGEDSDDYRRIKLEEGETPKEAIERTYGKKDNISKDYKENTSHYGKKEHQEEIISLYEGLKNPNKSEARKKEDRELLEHHLKELNKYSDTSGVHLSDEETKRENKIKEIKKELNKKQPDTKEESKKSKIDFSEYSDAELEHAIDVYKSNLSTAMEYGDAQYNAEKDMLSEIEKELGRRKAKTDTKDGKEETKKEYNKKSQDMQKELDKKYQEMNKKWQNGEVDYSEVKKFNEWYENAKKQIKEQFDKEETEHIADLRKDMSDEEKEFYGQPDKKEEKYEIPKDYKDSVKGYSKEKHEQAADFYGEKMATVQKKSVAHPENEDYRKQFEEYKALKDYHEEKAKPDSKGDKKYTWDDKEYTADELMEKGFKPMKYSGSIYKDDHLTYLEKNDGKKLYRVKISEDEYSKLEKKRQDKNKQLRLFNNKEQDMALLEELKKLITKVENTKGEKDMEIENEKVDKRDIIRQIMAIAGKEEASEDVKTIAKLAEKLAYDKSEAGTADNEKEDKKEDAENCKAKNEDDEKEVKEVKEEIKEDVDNKCKNSKEDYFSKLNEIYNAASKVQEKVEYTSRADREKAAEEYFAR